MSYQQIIITGHLGGDPELKYTPDGKAVCNFNVAANLYKDKTVWHRVAVWREQAEACNQYLHKGSLVQVVGTVEPRAYTSNAGEVVGTLEVTAQRVVFLSSSKAERSAPPADGEEVPF